VSPHLLSSLFFSHDPATPDLYTLSLHDALPICPPSQQTPRPHRGQGGDASGPGRRAQPPSTPSPPRSTGGSPEPGFGRDEHGQPPGREPGGAPGGERSGK